MLLSFPRLTPVLLFAFIFAPNLFAQESTDPPHQEEEEHHHHVSGFAGFTTDHKGKNGYKLGLEYEYRLTEMVGLGGTLDFTGNDFRIFSFSVGSTFYPFSFPLIPAVAVGAKHSNDKWDIFFRTMLIYDFHIDNISIGPMVMWDIYPGEKDIFSYGVTAGFSIH